MRRSRSPCMVVTVAAGALGACAETGKPVDDATLAAKVRAALQKDQTLRSFGIAVASQNAVVQLSGAVDTPAEADHAQEVAVNVRGIRTVRNNLTVK